MEGSLRLRTTLVPKANLTLLTIRSLDKVVVKGACVARLSLSHHPHLYSPLNWLFRHILPKLHPSLVLNHALIDAQVSTSWLINVTAEVNQWPHFVQGVIARVTPVGHQL